MITTIPPDSRAGEGLTDILKRIDCAFLRNTTNAQGKPVISGTVPDESEKTKLIKLASNLLPELRPEVHVEIMPPPLCRSLLEIESMRAVGLASEQIDARLAGRASALHEGDPIQVAVKAGNYPVSVRMDYFQLDGQVTHMLPNPDQPSVKLAAGARRVFGSGQRGEAWYTAPPFGTEFIAVLATPKPLDLAERPSTEDAGEYLRAVEAALRRSRTGTAQPSLLATILVLTRAR